jgi:hypothetical protein
MRGNEEGPPRRALDQAAGRGEEHPVPAAEPGTGDLAAEDPELVPEQMNEEVAGGISQCQATVDEVLRRTASELDVVDEDGFRTGDTRLCRPVGCQNRVFAPTRSATSFELSTLE